MAIFFRNIHFLFIFCLLSLTASAEEQLYTVKPGDTLWSISDEYLHDPNDWGKLQTLNQIVNPRKLLPNSQIRIPVLLLKNDNVQAVIKHMQGSAILTNHAGQVRDIVVGDPLFSGDKIVTNESSNILIEYVNGSKSLLQENSQLIIERINISTEDSDVQLKLLKGTIHNTVKPKLDKSDQRFIITTPSAVASVRGTVFRVGNNPQTQQFRTEVLEGRVAVVSQGEERVVETGFGVTIKEGQPPGVPIRLLPAIDLSQIPVKFIQPPFFFRLTALEQAVGYRVEIEEDGEFSLPIFGQNIVAPEFTHTNLTNGKYLLRAFAFDTAGLGGKAGLHRFEIEVESAPLAPKKPDLISPDDQALIKKKNFVFQWNPAKNANGYHFQLANDKTLIGQLINIYPYYSTTLAIADRFPSGKYYWNVAALDKNHQPGAYTELRSFRIPPQIPVLAKAKYKNDQIILNWTESKPSANYHLLVSTNKDFSNLIIDEQIPDTSYTFETETTGDYFVKVSVIENDGFQGDPSQLQHIKISKQGFFGRKIVNMPLDHIRVNFDSE